MAQPAPQTATLGAAAAAPALPASPPGRGKLHRRFGGFVVLSGLGWALDFTVYNLAASAGLRLFAANLIGASLGMGFVFSASRLAMFQGSRASLPRAGGLYAAWTVCVILMSSAMIDGVGQLLASASVRPLLTAALSAAQLRAPLTFVISALAKVLVTPLTLLMNFTVMTLIHRQPAHSAGV